MNLRGGWEEEDTTATDREVMVNSQRKIEKFTLC